jgi:hypothetical protein
MRNRNSSAGFTAPLLAFVLAVVFIAGTTAWFVYRQRHSTPKHAALSVSNLPSLPSTNSSLWSAPQIHSASDLDTALQTIDNNDPASDNADLVQLGSQASAL